MYIYIYTFTCMHLADTFIQSKVHSGYTLYYIHVNIFEIYTECVYLYMHNK